MNHPAQTWKDLDKLVLVAGHAVYVGKDFVAPERDEQWWLQDFQRGEPPFYIEHIRAGVELAASQPHSLLVFAGGQTRLMAGPRSEGQSYWMLADRFSWWQKAGVCDRATTEEFGRDSLENILFGLARFRECTGHYPASMEIVGWEFKRERFDFHRQTARWPGDDQHYRYHGANNPADLTGALRGEARAMAAFRQDPFATEGELLEKRIHRNPFRRQNPYALSCPEIAALLQHRTRDGMEFSGNLPWDSPEFRASSVSCAPGNEALRPRR
jgi:hypothetical protein